MNDMIGNRIDNYRIDAVLGKGGMGVVYRAQDVHLNRTVALKVMKRDLAEDRQFQQRFLQEAQAAARLKHPSIVPVYHFGNRQGLLYMANGFVPGPTLGVYLRRLQQEKKQFLLRESLTVVAQIADALGYAHRQDVVHRDIKPDNVLLEKLDVPDREGEPPVRAVVTDFGLAKLREGGLQTETGAFLGTMPYMSPEQCRGRPVDGRTDIYSLGILLYQLVTGRLPFENIKTPVEAAEKHIREMPPPPREIRPELPEAVESIIVKSIAKQPEERYQTGEEMAQALRETAEGISDALETELVETTPAVSLVTQLMPEFDDSEAPSIGPSLIPPAGADYLIIQREGEATRSQKLEKALMMIGRSPQNDIVLDRAGVSRQHARLERTTTGWQIIDMGSSNGTWVKSSQLLPNNPESWEPSQVARIGPYFLRWQPAGGTTLEEKTKGMADVPSGATQILTMDGQLGIVVNPTNVEVAPGRHAEVQVELINQGFQVDHFELLVEGIPAEWVTIAQEPVQLMPEGKASLPFTIHPPRHSSAHAGRHGYRLIIYSQTSQREAAAVEGNVTVEPYVQFSYEAQPTRLVNGGVCRVSIQNEGNSQTAFTVRGRDQAEAIRFGSGRRSLSIPPGQGDELLLDVQPKARPLTGRVKAHSFQIQVEADGETQLKQGVLEVQPRFPGWVMALIPIAAIICCVSAVLGANYWTTTNQSASQTATAVALQALAGEDADGDGLSNSREDQLGTNPTDPDTDKDGLRDGEEVDTYFTSPVNPDSDNDGLKDGDEITLGTFANVADSDGDGQLDGIDSEPLATSTPAPDLGATQAAEAAANANATATSLAMAAGNAATSTALALAQQTAAAQQTQQAIQAQQTQEAQIAASQTAQALQGEIAGTQTAEALQTQIAGTQTAQALQTQVAATETAQAGATATALARLVADYPLTTDGEDVTGKQGNMTLENAPFVADGLYCNGIYPSGGGSNPCVISTPNLNGFDYDSFSIQMAFNADEFKRMPVFVGGRSFRWIGFELNVVDDGSVSLLHNNSNREPCTVTYEPNQWHTALITYDGTEAKLYLDRVLGCTVTFDLNHGNDRDVSVINYSNGTIFQGSVRNLRIYNEPIQPLLIRINPNLVVTPLVISP